MGLVGRQWADLTMGRDGLYSYIGVDRNMRFWGGILKALVPVVGRHIGHKSSTGGPNYDVSILKRKQKVIADVTTTFWSRKEGLPSSSHNSLRPPLLTNFDLKT